MLDVVFVATLIAFFALMVAFVRWCEHIVGKEEATPTDPTDNDDTALTEEGDDGPEPDPLATAAPTAQTPEEVPS